MPSWVQRSSILHTWHIASLLYSYLRLCRNPVRMLLRSTLWRSRIYPISLDCNKTFKLSGCLDWALAGRESPPTGQALRHRELGWVITHHCFKIYLSFVRLLSLRFLCGQPFLLCSIVALSRETPSSYLGLDHLALLTTSDFMSVLAFLLMEIGSIFTQRDVLRQIGRLNWL